MRIIQAALPMLPGRVASALALVAVLTACPGQHTTQLDPKVEPPPIETVPSQILGTGNYEVVWSGLNYGKNQGFMRHIIAARDVSFENSLAVGNIDVISTVSSERTNIKGDDQSVAPLYGGRDAIVSSVEVSVGAPERVAFLIKPLNGVVVGQLMMSDLSLWPPSASPVPSTNGSAVNVPSGGYFFGKTGNSLLYVEQVPTTGGAGRLVWTEGTKATLIGGGALPKTIVLSSDRSRAVALVNQIWQWGDTNYGSGDLIAINMENGKSALVASGITGMANAYGQKGCPSTSNADCLLTAAFDRAYSMNRDGRLLAYAKGGTVFVASVDYSGEVPVVTQTSIGAGRFPGLSPSGKRVAFYDDAGSLQVYDVTNPASPTPITSTPSAGYLCPTFSPDDAYVVFLEKLLVKGNDPVFGSDIGTMRVMTAKAGAVPVTYSEYVLWHSLTFWPSDPARATVQMSVLGNVRDPLNLQVHTAEHAVADLLVDGPGSLPRAGRTRSSSPVQTSVQPVNVALLPASGGFGILTATSPAAMATPNADVWLPQSPVVRPGSTQHLAQFVLAGTLQTSASITGLESVDEVIVSVSNPSYAAPFKGRLPRGDLWGSAAGTASLLKADVFFQTLTTDGRALAIHPQTDSDDNTTTEIWSLPLQGGR